MALSADLKRVIEEFTATLHTFADAGALGTGDATAVQNEVFTHDRYTHSVTITLDTASDTGDVTVDVEDGSDNALFTATIPEDATSATVLTRAVLPAGETLTLNVTDAGANAVGLNAEVETRPVFL